MGLDQMIKKYYPDYTHARESAPVIPEGNGNPYAQVPPPGFPPQPAPGMVPAATPPALDQFAATIDNMMPVLERITGLTRRELFLQLLKTGVRGGGVASLLDGLIGQKPPAEAKFIRYTKTLAVWVPVAVFLMGLSVLGVVLFAKLITFLIGGI